MEKWRVGEVRDSGEEKAEIQRGEGRQLCECERPGGPVKVRTCGRQTRQTDGRARCVGRQ